MCMMLASQGSRITNVFERRNQDHARTDSGALASSAEEAPGGVIVKISIVASDLFAERFLNHEPALVAYR